MIETVSIIYGPEIYIQCPSNLETQVILRSHTTVKFLVAIDTFAGVIIILSGVYGNSSDRLQ